MLQHRKMNTIFCLLVILPLWVGVASADNIDTLRLIRELGQRVEDLEARDQVFATTIAENEIRETRYIERIAELEAFNKQHEEDHQMLRRKLEEMETTKSSTSVENIHRRRDARWLRQAETESPVAFLATLGNHFQQAGVNQTFTFEQIVTNVGGAYDNYAGIFKAPYAGIYVFSTTLVSWNEVSAHAHIYKNDRPINIMFVSGRVGAADTTSATVVLELAVGDDVTVRNGADGGVSYYGLNHSLFSGFLLHESFSNGGNIIGK